MELKIKVKRLKEYFNKINTIIKKRTPSAYLENILIEIKDNNVYLKVSDLETIIHIKLKDSEFILLDNVNKSFCINYKFIKGLIQSSNNEFIHMKITDNEIEIISNNLVLTKYTLNCFNFELFDVKEQHLKYNTKYSLKANKFKSMIKKTIKFVSKNDNKLALTGQLIDINNNRLNLVTIDGFRVAIQNTFINNKENNNGIAKKETMNVLKKIINTKDNIDIDISLNQYLIRFEYDNYTIYGNIIDCKYLKYDDIFYTNFDLSVEVNTKEIINHLKVINSLFKQNKYTKMFVKLNIQKDKISISTLKESPFEYLIDIPILKNITKELEIAFNSNFLIDIIENIEEEYVKLNFSKKDSPLIIDNDNYKYLIMPIKINQK